MLVSIWFFFNVHEYTITGKNNLIRQDKFGYYIYLPAAFIYQDFTYRFLDTFPDPIPPADHWAYAAPNGVLVSKMTMGVAVMNSPFFLLAHAQTLISGDFPAHGYSQYYRFWGSFGALVYAWIALWLLARLLRRWFDEPVVAITIAGIGLGTNYFYYVASEGMMSHGYSFFLFTAGMWLTVKVFEHPTWRNVAGLGAILGLIVLIRPTNAVFALVPVLFGVTDMDTLRERLRWAASHWAKIALAGLLVIAIFFPQLLIWKHVTGSWFFYSYGTERFHFEDPQFFNGLFSYRKGWYLYTPLMLAATLGLPVVYRYARTWALASWLTICVGMYIVLSWWCWWYGGSFGLRALVEFYPLMSLGLASIVAALMAGRWPAKILLAIIFTGCIFLNGFQTYQYRRMFIHWDSMTRAVYWDVFGRLQISGEEMQYINRNLGNPDYKHR